MNSGHLPFPRPIHASRPIEPLLHLRNAATLTWVERECFLKSAEQAGLRRHSTVRQQERGSRRCFLFQVRQYLLNDDGILNAGNYLSRATAGSASLNDDDLFFWASAGWEITRKLIKKLNAEVEAAGSRLVLLHFPSEGLVRSGIPLSHEEFDTFLDQNGIPHVSLFHGYYALEPGKLHQYFIPNDGHWPPHGHRYVAKRTRKMLFNTLSGQ